MIRNFILYSLLVLLPGTSFSSESFVGNYSRTPNDEAIIKITKIGKLYYIQASSNLTKDLPYLHKKPPKNITWGRKEKGINYTLTD